jgi:hypothetical protein
MQFSHIAMETSHTRLPGGAGPCEVVRFGMASSAALSNSMVKATSAADSKAESGSGLSPGTADVTVPTVPQLSGIYRVDLRMLVV